MTDSLNRNENNNKISWVEMILCSMNRPNILKTLYFKVTIDIYEHILRKPESYSNTICKNDIKNKIEFSVSINKLYEQYIKYIKPNINKPSQPGYDDNCHSRVATKTLTFKSTESRTYIVINNNTSLIEEILVNSYSSKYGSEFYTYQMYDFIWQRDEVNGMYYPNTFKIKCITQPDMDDYKNIFGKIYISLTHSLPEINKCEISNFKYTNLKSYDFFESLCVLERYIEGVNDLVQHNKYSEV